jgi:hypothetical protein
MGHVAAPEPTSTGRCGWKLQLVWQCVDTRTAPYLDLELIYGGTRGTRSSETRYQTCINCNGLTSLESVVTRSLRLPTALVCSPLLLTLAVR